MMWSHKEVLFQQEQKRKKKLQPGTGIDQEFTILPSTS
jgi:hypothetical protein